MKHILDTHAFLWFISGDDRLSKNARHAIETVEALSWISIASLWEIAIKTKIGKLDIGMPFKDLRRHIEKNGFEVLAVRFEHILLISELPLHHQDPFDRLIIAQSQIEKRVIITKDPTFKSYGVETLW